MLYSDALTEAMTWLGSQNDSVFLGQSVRYPGNALYGTLSGVPDDKKIEMPVMEDAQMGMSIGLSLTGKMPISIFPRVNFLICAMNQLVNHLDKMVDYSQGRFTPKVIIRTCIGSERPMDPGPQHKGDFPFEKVLKNIFIVRLTTPGLIVPMYQDAYYRPGSSLIIEYGDYYNKEYDNGERQKGRELQGQRA